MKKYQVCVLSLLIWLMDFAIKIIEISLVQKIGERYVALYLTPFIFAEESQSEAFTLFFFIAGSLDSFNGGNFFRPRRLSQALWLIIYRHYYCNFSRQTNAAARTQNNNT